MLFKHLSRKPNSNSNRHNNPKQHKPPAHKPEQVAFLKDPKGLTQVLSSILLFTQGISSILIPIHQ